MKNLQKIKINKLKILNNYIKKFKSNKNLILVTHYVLISEVLNYAPSSGEIVVSDKNFNMIGSRNKLLKYYVIKKSNETSTKTSLC